MNINYAILKINNYFGLLRYDAELTKLIDAYFGFLPNGDQEVLKQVETQNILYYLEEADNKGEAYRRVMEMLRDGHDSVRSQGFIHALKGSPKTVKLEVK